VPVSSAQTVGIAGQGGLVEWQRVWLDLLRGKAGLVVKWSSAAALACHYWLT
jgi:hypothetical protein